MGIKLLEKFKELVINIVKQEKVFSFNIGFTFMYDYIIDIRNIFLKIWGFREINKIVKNKRIHQKFYKLYSRLIKSNTVGISTN